MFRAMKKHLKEEKPLIEKKPNEIVKYKEITINFKDGKNVEVHNTMDIASIGIPSGGKWPRKTKLPAATWKGDGKRFHIYFYDNVDGKWVCKSEVVYNSDVISS